MLPAVCLATYLALVEGEMYGQGYFCLPPMVCLATQLALDEGEIYGQGNFCYPRYVLPRSWLSMKARCMGRNIFSATHGIPYVLPLALDEGEVYGQDYFICAAISLAAHMALDDEVEVWTGKMLFLFGPAVSFAARLAPDKGEMCRQDFSFFVRERYAPLATWLSTKAGILGGRAAR